MKSKILTRRPAPTTGTSRTATAAVFGSASYRRRHLHRLLGRDPAGGEGASYLSSLSSHGPDCEPGHYYLLNNYNPGYFGDGTNAYTDIGNPLTCSPSRPLPAHHRGRAPRGEHLLGVLRRPVEPLSRQSRQQLRHVRQHVLQHLQPVPVFDLHHDQRLRTTHLLDTTTSIRRSRTVLCLRSRS